MLDLEEALNLFKDIDFQMPTEEVILKNSHNRVLALDILSDIDIPPFDKSAMDGYACRKADLNIELKVTGTIHAGEEHGYTVRPGTCIKIMTGASLPKGADTVIIFEDTMESGKDMIRFLKTGSKSNICYQGEDVKKSETVLRKGTLLLPHHIGILASVGATRILVYSLPGIALISTGSELVEPDIAPGESKIRNSNAYNLMAQLGRMGIEPYYAGIVHDDPETLKSIINKLVPKNDILILTGGASAGEHDYVPGVLENSGLKIFFNRIAIQPGKPVSFAGGKNKFCFGLSGNPVSSYLQFELLVKPFIYKIMGYSYKYPIINTQLVNQISRKKADRLKFFPVRFTPDHKAEEIKFNGSAHIAGLV